MITMMINSWRESCSVFVSFGRHMISTTTTTTTTTNTNIIDMDRPPFWLKILLILLVLAAHVQQIDTVGGRGVAISSKGNRMSIGAKPVDADEDSGTLTVILVVILPVAQMFAVLLLIIFIRMFYRCVSNSFRRFSCFCCRGCCCLNEDGGGRNTISGSGCPQSKSTNQKGDKKIKDKTKMSKPKSKTKTNNLQGHHATPTTVTTNNSNQKNPSKQSTTIIPLTMVHRYQCYVPEVVPKQLPTSTCTTRICSPTMVDGHPKLPQQLQQKYHPASNHGSNTGSSSSAATTTKCPPPPQPHPRPPVMDNCVLQIEQNIVAKNTVVKNSASTSCLNGVADPNSIQNHHDDHDDDDDDDSQCPYFIHKNDQYSGIANENGPKPPNQASIPKVFQKPKSHGQMMMMKKSQDHSMIMMVIDDEFHNENHHLESSSSINGLEDLIDDGDDDQDDEDEFHENGQFQQPPTTQCIVQSALKISNQNQNQNPNLNNHNIINCCDPLQHPSVQHPGVSGFSAHHQDHHPDNDHDNMMMMWNSLMNYHQQQQLPQHHRPPLMTTFKPTATTTTGRFLANCNPTKINQNQCPPHTY